MEIILIASFIVALPFSANFIAAKVEHPQNRAHRLMLEQKRKSEHETV